MPVCGSCNEIFGASQGLAQHKKATGHCCCNHCGRIFKYPRSLEQHNLALHNWFCGDCNKSFSARESLGSHQKSTGHCYCRICDRYFVNKNAVVDHTRALHLSVSEFRCCDCDRAFVNELALKQHLRDKVHVIKRMEEPLFTCSECKRQFGSQSALNQHKRSLSHKPISNLKCMAGKMGSGCQRNFSSPSAMIQHLESGACPSGLNRQKINETLEAHDTDHIITQPEDNGLLKDGIEDLTLNTDACSSDQSMVLTPDSNSDTDFRSSLVALTTRCPFCPQGSRQFSTLKSLQQHLDSPVHSPNLFRCPISLVPMSPSKPPLRKSFTTLSGLAQHLESGSCAGGRTTLKKVAAYIEARLETMGMKKVKLLL